MRRGSANTTRGIVRFVDELAAMLKRASATGAMTVRADSGFWSWKLVDRLDAHGIGWSITVRLHKNIKTAIADIDESAWINIDYTIGGQAQVAQTTYTAGRPNQQRTVRLIVRRTRFTEPAQRRLWPDWRHHAFITSDHDISTTVADAFHREHACLPSQAIAASYVMLACGATLDSGCIRTMQFAGAVLQETHPPGCPIAADGGHHRSSAESPPRSSPVG